MGYFQEIQPVVDIMAIYNIMNQGKRLPNQDYTRPYIQQGMLLNQAIRTAEQQQRKDAVWVQYEKK